MTRGQQETGARELAWGGGEMPASLETQEGLVPSYSPRVLHPSMREVGDIWPGWPGGLRPCPRGPHRQEVVIPRAVGWAAGPSGVVPSTACSFPSFLV